MTTQEYTIKVNIEDCSWTKVFNGWRDNAEKEGYDYMNILIAQYIADNKIYDPEEQQSVIEHSYYSFSYNLTPYEEMFAVLATDAEDPIIATFSTKADAEEMIYALCEEWATDILRCEDSLDILGKTAWDYKNDFKFLMADCAKTYSIQLIPAFGIQDFI